MLLFSGFPILAKFSDFYGWMPEEQISGISGMYPNYLTGTTVPSSSMRVTVFQEFILAT